MACPKEETWQSKRSFEKTNWHMLLEEKLCDVTFLVGSSKQEKLIAHKYILASRSPVFYAMFCGSLPETSGPVEVPDIEPVIFREMLRFIYTEDTTFNETNSMALLYCSKKYDIKRLQEACKTFLQKHISFDNVCTILQHAIQFDEGDLEKRCLRFVTRNAEGVLESDGLLTIPKEVLKKLIESDDLFVNELNVYDACKRWAIAQSKEKTDQSTSSEIDLRRVLGDVIHSVRFPIMSFQTFAEKVATEDILTAEEKVFVFQSIAGLDSSKILQPSQFLSRKRSSQFDIVELKRFSSIFSRNWLYGGKPDVLDFRVSIPCTLLGFYLFTPACEGTVGGEVSLQSGTSILASAKNIKIKYEVSKFYEKILLDKKVDIEPKTKYTIYAILKGKSTFSGNDGQSKVLSGPLEVVFSENDRSTNGTSPTGGQIHSVIFEVTREQE